ncbi:MAG TPA: hypothetical protein VMZ26_09320 [Pyrinomonadaceae bacterium]|nr:hypothetical protein [Pyrinomonadaceae bacterium]
MSSTLQRYQNEFYIYLMSNANPDQFPDNTASEFTNLLQTPVNFAPGDVTGWEVGIAELIIPSAFYNITDGVNTLTVRHARGANVQEKLGTESTRTAAAAAAKSKKPASAADSEFLEAQRRQEKQMEKRLKAEQEKVKRFKEEAAKKKREEEAAKLAVAPVSDEDTKLWAERWDNFYASKRDYHTLDEMDELKMIEWNKFRKERSITRLLPPKTTSPEYDAALKQFLVHMLGERWKTAGVEGAVMDPDEHTEWYNKAHQLFRERVHKGFELIDTKKDSFLSAAPERYKEWIAFNEAQWNRLRSDDPQRVQPSNDSLEHKSYQILLYNVFKLFTKMLPDEAAGDTRRWWSYVALKNAARHHADPGALDEGEEFNNWYAARNHEFGQMMLANAFDKGVPDDVTFTVDMIDAYLGRLPQQPPTSPEQPIETPDPTPPPAPAPTAEIPTTSSSVPAVGRPPPRQQLTRPELRKKRFMDWHWEKYKRENPRVPHDTAARMNFERLMEEEYRQFFEQQMFRYEYNLGHFIHLEEQSGNDMGAGERRGEINHARWRARKRQEFYNRFEQGDFDDGDWVKEYVHLPVTTDDNWTMPTPPTQYQPRTRPLAPVGIPATSEWMHGLGFLARQRRSKRETATEANESATSAPVERAKVHTLNPNRLRSRFKEQIRRYYDRRTITLPGRGASSFATISELFDKIQSEFRRSGLEETDLLIKYAPEDNRLVIVASAESRIRFPRAHRRMWRRIGLPAIAIGRNIYVGKSNVLTIPIRPPHRRRKPVSRIVLAKHPLKIVFDQVYNYNNVTAHLIHTGQLLGHEAIMAKGPETYDNVAAVFQELNKQAQARGGHWTSLFFDYRPDKSEVYIQDAYGTLLSIQGGEAIDALGLGIGMDKSIDGRYFQMIPSIISLPLDSFSDDTPVTLPSSLIVGRNAVNPRFPRIRRRPMFNAAYVSEDGTEDDVVYTTDEEMVVSEDEDATISSAPAETTEIDKEEEETKLNEAELVPTTLTIKIRAPTSEEKEAPQQPQVTTIDDLATSTSKSIAVEKEDEEEMTTPQPMETDDDEQTPSVASKTNVEEKEEDDDDSQSVEIHPPLPDTSTLPTTQPPPPPSDEDEEEDDKIMMTAPSPEDHEEEEEEEGEESAPDSLPQPPSIYQHKTSGRGGPSAQIHGPATLSFPSIASSGPRTRPDPLLAKSAGPQPLAPTDGDDDDHDNSGDYERTTIALPAGHYRTARALVDAVRQALEDEVPQSHGKPFRLDVMQDGRLRLTSALSSHAIRFDDGLHDILGLAESLRGRWLSTRGNVDRYDECRPIELSGGMDFFIVYSDVGDIVRLGNSSGRVLRCVDSSGAGGSTGVSDQETIALHFPNIYYVPVCRSSIQSVHLAIYTDFGQPVRFTRGKTLAVLHFRRRAAASPSGVGSG